MARKLSPVVEANRLRQAALSGKRLKTRMTSALPSECEIFSARHSLVYSSLTFSERNPRPFADRSYMKSIDRSLDALTGDTMPPRM